MLDVCLLGTGGMMPLPDRFLTSLACRLNGKILLIDCGEGTQVTLKLTGWGYKAIDVICFTHFHADHVSGLPGLLLAIANSDRSEDIHIIGPVGLKEVVKGLTIIAPKLPFNLLLHEIVSEDNALFGEGLSLSGFNIRAVPAEHRIPCVSYRIDVKRPGKFMPEKAKELGLPITLWNVIQKEGFAEYDGKVYTSDMVMGEERKGISVSYATDSRPSERLTELVRGSDLLVCEGIYGEDEKIEKAIGYGHMVFSEAATMAKNGEVGELWLTHFSPSLTEPELFLDVAKGIFENSVVGFDRIGKQINFAD